MAMQLPPEKLGTFYLGAEYDIDAAQRKDAPILYDARDLTTHAVCVGMTGSGKTGLCIGLLEEAALDRVPCIIIDPKGDMTNLLLQFPQLQPGDFRPWINEDDAARKGKTPDEFATSTAETWRNGLLDWGITGDRIRALQETVQYTVFTPGSDAGIPVNILGSLAAPKLDWDAEGEAIRERIGGTVAALLGLAGLSVDPVRSREAVLLSTVFEHHWRQDQDVDLAKLILSIQTPPTRQIGVFDVDTFYPPKDRFELAMAFNNIMAAPTFQTWLMGEPLDVDTMFYTANGKPRHSIFYIAHLSDSERMFFVTLLLENMVTWMRRQTGTTSLRALLYFDEIFGFFPPTAEPPSKRPLLTLMKQARAFGLGVVLVTQNPVDLDYKGLTNAGTWLIGKLQAERDKARVLEGLKGAISEAGGNADVDYDATISKLGSRVFLMHNVHQGKPVVFNTRWAHSYLRGPLTRPQVRTLMADRKAANATAAAPVAFPAGGAAAGAVAAPAASSSAPAAIPGLDGFNPVAPSLDPTVQQAYIPIRVSDQAAVRQLSQETGSPIVPSRISLTYEPAALGITSVRFADRTRRIDTKIDRVLVAPIPTGVGALDWDHAEPLQLSVRDLTSTAEQVEPEQGPFFAPVPERANSATELKKIGSELTDWLYYNTRLTLLAHDTLGVTQNPGESERDFKIRLEQAGREQRDSEVDKLEQLYERQISRIVEKLDREQRELAQDESEKQARQGEQWVSIGESVLSWFMGRRSIRAVSGAVGKYRQTSKAAMDVEESKQEIEKLGKQKSELETELKEKTDDIAAKWESLAQDVRSQEIAPRRSDVDISLLALAWLPSWVIEYEFGGRSRTATVAAYALPAQ